MITITKDIAIKIDKGDVPVLLDICEMARRYMGGEYSLTEIYSLERKREVRKFLNIIFEGLK